MTSQHEPSPPPVSGAPGTGTPPSGTPETEPAQRTRRGSRLLWPLRQLDLLLWAVAAWYAGAQSGRIELSLTLAVLALVVLLPRRLPGGASERLRTRLLLGLAVACLTQAAGPDLVRFTTTDWVRSWNVFHYYLGAEYYDELGYHDLYRAALVADSEGTDGEGAGVWRSIDRVRDLETYRVEPREEELAEYRPLEAFSPERWSAFRADVAILADGMPAGSFRNVFTDRGYNATPFWTFLGAVLTKLLPARHLLTYKLLLALDLLLLAAALALVKRTFGTRALALVLLLFALSPVNLGRLVGGFLQYDWFSAFVLGFCWYPRRQPVAAAAGMAYAALARVFPVVFVAAGVLPLAWAWWRHGQRPTVFHRRFLAAYVLFGVVGLGLGSLTPRGPAAWLDFARIIEHHSHEHVFGQRRVGLEHLFTRDLDQPLEETSISERREAHRGREGLVALSTAALLGLWLWVIRRRRSADGQLLGLVPFFSLTVSSRYYWSYLAMLPLLGQRAGPEGSEERPRELQRWVSAGQVAVFAGFYLYSQRVPDRYAAYWWLNLLLLVFLLTLLLGYLVTDGRSKPGDETRREAGPQN
ncbi:MAG: glycosyltransferase 87 family protein [Acidobacteriota bacterium]|nr:glycosyltransferase 87 family protein [Acidobacteriota bacterium]